MKLDLLEKTSLLPDMLLITWFLKNRKQAVCTLDKWMKKGKWNYGCNIEVGWKVKLKDEE